MFFLEGVSLLVINEVSNTNKLESYCKKNQNNMRTAEETSLALVVCFARYFSGFFLVQN